METSRFEENRKFEKEEISSLVRYIMTLDEEAKAVYSSYIFFSTSNDLMDPNDLMSQVILNITSVESLYLLGLAKRCGADFNKHYETDPYLPATHPFIILSIAYLEGNMTEEVYIEAYNIILQFGGNMLYPAFSYSEDTADVDMHYIAEMEETTEAETNVNVEDWFLERQLVPETYILEYLPEPNKSYLAAILDAPYLYDTSELDESAYLELTELPNVTFLLKCLSYRILKSSPVDINHVVSFENNEIRQSIRCMNHIAYKIFAEKGFETTYFSINRACLFFNLAEDTISKEYYREIIREMIKTGHSLTKDHLELINNDPELVKLYRVPKWKKLSTKPDYNFEELRKIAFELNIDYNSGPGKISRDLQTLDAHSVDDLLKMMKARQCERIKNSVNFLGQKEACECPNTAYADARIVFYKDEDGKVHMFTSEMYESLLRYGKNPNTGKALPFYVLEEVKGNLEILKTFGIQLNTETKKEVEKFKEIDDFTDKEDKIILNTVDKTSKLYGIGSMDIPVGLMMIILGYIGMDTDYFPFITKSHQVHTFSRAVYEYTRYESYKAPYLFEYILQANLYTSE